MTHHTTTVVPYVSICAVCFNVGVARDVAVLNVDAAWRRLRDYAGIDTRADTYWTSAEMEVVRSFEGWLERVTSELGPQAPSLFSHGSSFLYQNNYTGRTLVFVPWEGYGDYHVSHLE